MGGPRLRALTAGWIIKRSRTTTTRVDQAEASKVRRLPLGYGATRFAASQRRVTVSISTSLAPALSVLTSIFDGQAFSRWYRAPGALRRRT